MAHLTAPIAIVALDVPTAVDAMRLVRVLGDNCSFYKVGSELFTAEGPAVVRALRDAGNDVFLDLKFHDIPQTVRSAAREAARLGARLVTVHAAGGEPMLRAAREGAEDGADAEGGCGVLAVTVLTSMDELALRQASGRDGVAVRDEVLRLAEAAARADVHGVVCSGAEAAELRDRHGDRLARLVPGVRLAGGPTHDQARVVTPEQARQAGATYVVIGRAVTAAESPAEAMRTVRAALAGEPAVTG